MYVIIFLWQNGNRINVAPSLVFVGKLSYSLSEKYTLSYVKIDKSNLSGLFFKSPILRTNLKMYFRLSSAVSKCSSADIARMRVVQHSVKMIHPYSGRK